jgi:DNA segregation ATPase FtsK/SpoIIIE, S-DNA-T family
MGRSNRDVQTVRIQRDVVHEPVWMLLLGLVVRGLLRLVWFLLRHWRLTLPALGLVWLWVKVGTGPLLALLAVLVAGLAAWCVAHHASFEVWVRWPVTSRWRAWWRYGRSWDATMKGCGLTVRIDGDVYVPDLLSVASSRSGDVVRLKMLRGQTPDTFTTSAEALGYAYGTRMCRVLSGRVNIRPTVHAGPRAWVRFQTWRDRRRYSRDVPAEMTVMFVRGDLLSFVVPPVALSQIPATPDLARLTLGLVEDGAPYLLRLEQSHVLIAGATGAGKGSVIWGLIRALAGGIRSGLVQVWAIDPKGGMELAMGRRLFTCFEYQQAERMADLLDAAIVVMRDRQDRLAGRVRQHTPTRHDPTIVVLIDELAALTAYLPDKQLRERIKASLAVLLSQGRALGVHVVAALQDPRKEVVEFRDLFPTRIGLRMTEDTQPDMVLGDGARKRGALADKIPASLPGVGYVILDHQPEPARVRFAYNNDADIADLANFYPAPLADTPPIPTQPTGNGSPNGYRGGRNGNGGGNGHTFVPTGLLDKLRGDQ